MQKITPFLWFDQQAEEAALFYTGIFKDSEVVSISRYGDGAPMPKGTVMTAKFILEGQEFVALNGGPHFTFNPAISFVVNCDSQQEVDYYWEKLLDGGTESQCAWLTDRFGVSWQIVPQALIRYLNDPDPVKAQRVMMAMMQMIKIDIATLDRAYQGL
ncbi:VOC family protein [Undibacterium sp. CY18W]|uniref:VOC family protein n=1 Tax=Undibacterium hunanense TaxID=2762292 RepID=A0ABR6ZLZ6_9BURK|nr:VOC family protein [Undibacterium hunanense]MBC3916906.1 VOC family protein [Undibacterium hunanense]